MLTCTLCEKETCYFSKFCSKCRRIKHLLNIYGDDVYSTLETVLVRNKQQQVNKIKIANKKIEHHLKRLEEQKTKNLEKEKDTEQTIKIIKPYNLRNSIKNN